MTRAFQLLFAMIIAGFLFAYFSIATRIDPLYAGTHFLIIGLALWHITRLKRFNLGASFSFFALFFFGFIPLFEYKLNITYSGASAARDSSYLFAGILALLSSVSFYLGYGLDRGSPMKVVTLGELRYLSRRHRQIVIAAAVIAIAALSAGIALYFELDVGNMLFRGFAEQLELSAFGYSAISFFVRPLLFNLIFLILLIRARQRGSFDVATYTLCMLLLVFVSPVGIPRTLTGALYIPLLMLVFFPRLISTYSVVCVIIFAVLLVAPIADIFRSVQAGPTVDLLSNFNLDYAFSGHFDAFFNLTQVVDLSYSSAGLQVMGALLFWIPRAIWPGKPVGTSFDFADYAGLSAHNVSFPLTAELYVDFGIFGVLLGMYILGLIYRRLDAYLSKPRECGSLFSYLAPIAHLELSILGIYLLRGSFLSSFAFTVGVASTFAVLGFFNAVLRGFESRRFRNRDAVKA